MKDIQVVKHISWYKREVFFSMPVCGFPKNIYTVTEGALLTSEKANKLYSNI